MESSAQTDEDTKEYIHLFRYKIAVKKTHQSYCCWWWWQCHLLKSSLAPSLAVQGVSPYHYKTCTSVMNWARWKLYWWSLTSHLLEDLIEMQVTWHGMATRAPITSDSKVSLRDRDVMSPAIVPVHSQALQVPFSLSYLPPLFYHLCILNQSFFVQLALYL